VTDGVRHCAIGNFKESHLVTAGSDPFFSLPPKRNGLHVFGVIPKRMSSATSLAMLLQCLQFGGEEPFSAELEAVSLD
jgi:hypothetical protein